MATLHDVPATSAKPVFIKDSDLPPSQNRYSVVEICRAAENTGGVGSVFGCQKIAGIWRLYPATEAARTKLLGLGFTLRHTRILPGSVNPRRVFTIDGIPVDASRLVISNVPLSFSTIEIKQAIEDLGCTLLSDIQLDCARDENGRLTSFKNGNRVIFIRTPTEPLPKSIKVGPFIAFLFYAERPENKARETQAPTRPDISSTPVNGITAQQEQNPVLGQTSPSDSTPRSEGAVFVASGPATRQGSVTTVNWVGAETPVLVESVGTDKTRKTSVREEGKERQEAAEIEESGDDTAEEGSSTARVQKHKTEKKKNAAEDSGERGRARKKTTESPRSRDSGSLAYYLHLGTRRSTSVKRAAEHADESPSKKVSRPKTDT